MSITRKSMISDTKKRRIDSPTFEASTELSFEKQLPQYVKPKPNKTEISGSIRPSTYDLFPGE